MGASTHPGAVHSREVNLQTIGKGIKHALLNPSKNAMVSTLLDQYLLGHAESYQGTHDEPALAPYDVTSCWNATTKDDE